MEIYGRVRRAVRVEGRSQRAVARVLFSELFGLNVSALFGVSEDLRDTCLNSTRVPGSLGSSTPLVE